MQKQQYFEYGDTEVAYLKAKDKALSKVIDEIGLVRRQIIPDIFMALVNSVIGQQISTKAHITVWERAQVMFAPFTPEHIASLPVETLQTCGISMRKAGYIKDIAVSAASGRLNLEELHIMDDDAVCRRLSELNGIGVWTAEMLMTFSMQRKDVLSWGDLAIHRGLRMLYRHRKVTPALFAKYKKRYSPYASVASLYLWELAGGVCEGYADPVQKVGSQKKKTTRKKEVIQPEIQATELKTEGQTKLYTLMGIDGKQYQSAEPGELGGYRPRKIYGRLDCAGAIRWIAKGKYVTHRVFFKDEETAILAGYRPCAKCMPVEYAEWKKKHEIDTIRKPAKNRPSLDTQTGRGMS